MPRVLLVLVLLTACAAKPEPCAPGERVRDTYHDGKFGHECVTVAHVDLDLGKIEIMPHLPRSEFRHGEPLYRNPFGE